MQNSTLPWHAQPADDALSQLGSGPGGLVEAEAARRLDLYGPNLGPAPARPGPLRRLLGQFNNVLIYVLLGSAAITAALGHWIDTGVILGVVLINALVGFIQEGRAEKALDAIRDMLAPEAVVVRGGARRRIGAAGLVPGDLVLLKSGDRVPADLRLTRANSLLVQEAALTGESQAAEKAVAALPADTPLGDRAAMAYSGTLVTYGTATGLVVGTGADTEIGRIGVLLAEIGPVSTPLLTQMAAFGRRLTIAILALAAATFLFGTLIRDYAASDMFLAAVGLAVAAIPEGLPAIMTIALAIGVTRMARLNAIIRRLPAVETLGSVTVICADKTGTLTRNELTVESVVTAGREYAVTGVGYAPDGEFRLDGASVAPADDPVLGLAIEAAAHCNDAELVHRDGETRLTGSPTDGALLTLALKAGLDLVDHGRRSPRTDLIPFESEHKFMATLHHDHDGRGHLYVKGAPERVLEMCRTARRDGADVPLDKAYWLAEIERIAAQGQRVIAVAGRAVAPEMRRIERADLDGQLVLYGLFGLIDPPRRAAIAAVARCREAGIRVKMITGDHAATARAVGAALGIGDDGRVVTGAELDAADDAALVEIAAEADVFARTTPEQKLRLVEALQAQGEVVAMTGDGVNDAPALKRADIGVAMGVKGTEAAKEAAEMVLADDNFASIAHAVEEGRTVYDNLTKSILFILPTSFGEAATVIAAVLLGLTLPITPVQILWINMVTTVTLALALGFEPADPGAMRRPPRPPGEPILSRLLVWRIAFVSVLLLAGAFGLFVLETAAGAGVEAARTMAVNAIVAGEAVYLVNCRRVYTAAWRLEGLFGSRPVLLSIVLVAGLQLLFTYLPVMQLLFATAPLGPAQWARVAAFAVAVFLLVEVEKALIHGLGRPCA